MATTIVVDVAPDGSCRIDVQGVKGKTCLDITAQLEKALGGTAVKRTVKPEMREWAVTDTAAVKTKG
jgi:hypothetical protein